MCAHGTKLLSRVLKIFFVVTEYLKQLELDRFLSRKSVGIQRPIDSLNLGFARCRLAARKFLVTAMVKTTVSLGYSKTLKSRSCFTFYHWASNFWKPRLLPRSFPIMHTVPNSKYGFFFYFIGIKKTSIFIFEIYVIWGCKLRIWNKFLAVGIGKPILVLLSFKVV